MEKNGEQFDLIVIGGGPAGMMAAGTAAGKGLAVLLLEKNKCLGQKLLLTGKGRCNLTNDKPLQDFISAFGKNGPFLYSTLHHFSNEDLKNFFETRSLKLKLERGGRYFPEDGNAQQVLRIVTKFLKEKRVKVLIGKKVVKVRKWRDNFVINVFGKQKFQSRKLVIATGGKSYPETGSSGDGYLFARSLDHTIVTPDPALVPLISQNKDIRQLQGLTLKNVRLTLLTQPQKEVTHLKQVSLFGEMLFTHFGVSGPIVLALSRTVFRLLKSKMRVLASIDFKPALSLEVLDKRLQRELNAAGRKSVATILKNLLPQKIIPCFLRRLNLDSQKHAAEVSKETRCKIAKELKDFRFEIAATLPLENGIITAGGVKLAEINPKTMESKLCPGLYFAGEILDLDGPSGGYNLTVAFCTGFMAGENSSL